MKIHYRCQNNPQHTDSDAGNNPPAPTTLLCYEPRCRGVMYPYLPETQPVAEEAIGEPVEA